MKKILIISALCLLVGILLALSLIGGWSVAVSLGLLFLGVFGYCPESFGLKVPRPISRLFLVIFILFSIWQMILAFNSEKETERIKAGLSKSLTQQQSFTFRVPVLPDGRPNWFASWHAYRFHDLLNSSLGYAGYQIALQMSSGWSENPVIPPYIQTVSPPDGFFVDAAELAVIAWLFRVSENNELSYMSTNGLIETQSLLKGLSGNFPDNKYITYLRGPPIHPLLFSSFRDSSPVTIDSHTRKPHVHGIMSAALSDNRRRSLIIEGNGYSIRITIHHDGRSKCPHIEEFGGAFKMATYGFPSVMTEDFTISTFVQYAEPEADNGHDETEAFVADLIARFRSAFDWEVFRNNLIVAPILNKGIESR